MKTITLSKKQEERYTKRAKRIINTLNKRAETKGKKGHKKLFKSCFFINEIVAKKIASGLRDLGYDVVENTTTEDGFEAGIILELIISWK